MVSKEFCVLELFVNSIKNKTSPLLNTQIKRNSVNLSRVNVRLKPS